MAEKLGDRWMLNSFKQTIIIDKSTLNPLEYLVIYFVICKFCWSTIFCFLKYCHAIIYKIYWVGLLVDLKNL